jgi:uncharacterized protein YndB with AHSA1/START domain
MAPSENENTTRRGHERTSVALALIVASVLGVRAGADVPDAAANGFTIHITTSVTAPAARVFESIVKVGSWWAPDHTYSGSSANLSLDPTPGGCWCEKLPGGGVQHLTVVFVDRNKTLRLRGGLGPLQEMGVDGALSFALKEANGATTVDVTYKVGGYAPGGLEAISKAVDGVLALQMGRLKRVVETGRPE